MPPKKRRGGNGQQDISPAAPGGDRLSALPDDVLHHVLSFLPAEEAVRTCVLARRWQHLWETATTLRILRRDVDVDDPETVEAAREFVDHLLLLRGGSPIDTCELSLSGFEDDDMSLSRINIWIRHILKCKVRVLSLDVHIDTCGGWFELNIRTLHSDHLKRLQLSNVTLQNMLLDFSCCPALEILEIDGSNLRRVDNISSQSLKCLSISKDCHFYEGSRTYIHTPNVHSVRLGVGNQRTPKLDRMPNLVEAFVNLCDYNMDWCHNSDHISGGCDHDDCFACYGVDGHTNHYVLLQGLSEARNLALMSNNVELFIFRRDLKLCPVFGNLKTLLLNEYWCMPVDFSALAYMLEHSPILEKLTLHLFCKGPKSKFEIEGKPDATERSSAISGHLKIVEVKCEVVDSKVFDVLNFLTTLGIYMCRFSS